MFVVVIFADTQQRAWVIIEVVEMAWRPANYGTYGLLLLLFSASRERDGRLTKVHIIIHCSGDNIVKKNMARHQQVMHAHVY